METSSALIARRSTKTQQDVRNILSASTSALSQNRIAELLTTSYDRITLYRILNRFCEDGIIHKIVALDGTSYYALCRHECRRGQHHDIHFHISCIECGGVYCTDQQVPKSVLKQYNAQQMNAVLTGTCETCSH